MQPHCLSCLFLLHLPERLLFVNPVAQVRGHMKGGKSCEIIYLAVIFLHHENLLFEQGCGDF